jgi:hypothetical protein
MEGYYCSISYQMVDDQPVPLAGSLGCRHPIAASKLDIGDLEKATSHKVAKEKR